MNAIIIYASKHGTTRKIATAIAERLKETMEVELVSLNDTPNPDISGNDIVVLGASIYAGQPLRRMKSFCKANEAVLLQKKTGLFVCGMHPDAVQREKELKEAYPASLLQQSQTTGFLHGEFIFEQMNYFERLIIKQIAKTTTSVLRTDWEDVYRFADELCTAVAISTK